MFRIDGWELRAFAEHAEGGGFWPQVRMSYSDGSTRASRVLDNFRCMYEADAVQVAHQVIAQVVGVTEQGELKFRSPSELKEDLSDGSK